jgi:hypothetical protein
MKTINLSFTKSVRNIVSAIVLLLACVTVAALVGSRATEAHAADLKPNQSSIAAPAATFTVNTTADPTPSNGLCSGTCSLRYAVNSANLTSGATIDVPAGMYALALGAITISQDMSIVGAGEISTTVDGGGVDRIFIVGPSTTINVSLSGMTLQRGFSAGLGGAIQDYGNLTLDSVTLFNNIVYNSGGGVGVWSGGALTVTNSTVISNAAGYGAGISGYDTTDKVVISHSSIISNTGDTGVGIDSVGPLTITNSLIANNAATGYGGGIRTVYGGSMSNSTVSGNSSINHAGGISVMGPAFVTVVTFTISNSTISDNVTTNSSGGGLDSVSSDATAILINSTVSHNRALNYGGGLYAAGGPIELFNTTVYSNSAGYGGGLYVFNIADTSIHMQNSIVAGNSASTLGQDCYGPVNSQGYNLVQNTADCSFISAAGDITGTNPLLGVLQNNGGSTWTHALLSHSPAINAGNPASCQDNNGTVLATDQRGLLRPFGGRCDIGSFEYQSPVTRAIYLPLVMR